MRRSNSPGPIAGVPLNIICSMKWETPVSPGLSLRDPTRKNVYRATLGMLWSSTSRTLRPFANVLTLTSSFLKAAGRDRDRAAKAATRSQARFLIRAPPPIIALIIPLSGAEGCRRRQHGAGRWGGGDAEGGVDPPRKGERRGYPEAPLDGAGA